MLETRIELLQDGEWFGYSYRWNQAQTDATLLLGGGVMDVAWVDDDGQQITRESRPDVRLPSAHRALGMTRG